jgi:hypothetical protein
VSHAAPQKRPSRADVLRLALAVVFFTAAPTAGDIGSCGQAEDDLDPARFFGAKQEVDCQRCADCELTSDACGKACSPGLLIREFPPGCVPLEHDGVVCIDALAAAGCGDYRRYMADEASTIPTECNFCPPQADAGAADAAADAEAE